MLPPRLRHLDFPLFLPDRLAVEALLNAVDAAVQRHPAADGTACEALATLTSESPALPQGLLVLDHPRPAELFSLGAWLYGDPFPGALRVGTPGRSGLQLLSPSQGVWAASWADDPEDGREFFLREATGDGLAGALLLNIGDGPPYAHHATLDSRHVLSQAAGLDALGAFASGRGLPLALGLSLLSQGPGPWSGQLPLGAEVKGWDVSEGLLEQGPHPDLGEFEFPVRITASTDELDGGIPAAWS
jgi:hypothetical protein